MRSTQPNHGVYLDLLRPLCTELSNNAPKQLKQACVSTTAKFASASIFNYPAIKCTNGQRLASIDKMLLICSKNGTNFWMTYLPLRLFEILSSTLYQALKQCSQNNLNQACVSPLLAFASASKFPTTQLHQTH